MKELKSRPYIFVKPEDIKLIKNLNSDFPNGCDIELSEGEFELSSVVHFPSNTRFRGQGPDKTKIVLAKGANSHMFTNYDNKNGNHNIVFKDMSFHGNRGFQSRPEGHVPLTYSCGIYFRRAQRIWLENLVFHEITQTALQFNNSGNIRGNAIETYNMGWSGIGTSNAWDLYLDNIVVIGAGLETTHSAIHFDGGIGNFINARVQDVTGNGIMLDSAYCGLSHCEIHGETSDCYRGISLSGRAERYLSNIFISANAYRNTEAGIMVSNSSSVVLGDCDIRDNLKHGLLLQGRAGGNDVVISKNCISVDNLHDYSQIHSSKNNWIFAMNEEAEKRINKGTEREYLSK